MGKKLLFPVLGFHTRNTYELMFKKRNKLHLINAPNTIFGHYTSSEGNVIGLAELGHPQKSFGAATFAHIPRKFAQICAYYMLVCTKLCASVMHVHYIMLLCLALYLHYHQQDDAIF